MKNNNIFKTCVILAQLLCTGASFSKEENNSSKSNLNQSITAVQQMNSSMQKINVIFAQCHLEHDCILKALQHLAQDEKNPVAKSMLNDFEKNEIINNELFSQCFELQKREADEALLICMTQSRKPPFLDDKTQCYENALIKLVDQGNAVAQQMLFTLYQMQNDTTKLDRFQEKISQIGTELHRKGNARCLGILKNNKK